jgi:predicted metalloprotease with PDZ domain
MARSTQVCAAVSVEIKVANVQAHLLTVRMTIAQPKALQTVSLPVWIPGSYMVREFAQHLQGLHGLQGGQRISAQALNKHQWQLRCDPQQPLALCYEVYAFDPSVRMAFLDDERCFFNHTSTVLQVAGCEDARHDVKLTQPKDTACRDWQLVTGLKPVRVNAQGFGRYSAQHYDELVDCPVTMGRMWCERFEVRGVEHVWAITGAPANLDGQRLIRDTRRIVEAEFDFWHGPGGIPEWPRYVFMMHAADNAYGGLEHRNSTALVCARKDLPQRGPDGSTPAPALKATDTYTLLLGLISHEYFHTWNVKRLRPHAFARYDYSGENYTEQLWFFEGFTSYYDDLILRRSGLLDDAAYLQLLAKTWNQVRQTPGESIQSVAESSFDAWTKYYRITENSPNATVSYYTKGALVALCLDAELRQGRSSLDALMRALWQRCEGGPMAMTDVRAALKGLGHAQLFNQLDLWVHSTDALPVERALQRLGVATTPAATPLPQRLGLRVREDHTGLHITHVLRGGAGEAMGLCPGDEWLSVQVASQHARVKKLADVAACIGRSGKFTAVVARDARVRSLKGVWPRPSETMQLQVANADAVSAWLNPST